MLYDLLNVYAATVQSSMPGCVNGVSCRPCQTMWQYGSSLNNGDVAAGDQFGEAAHVLGRRHAAGRIVRRIEENRLRARLAADEAFDIVEIGPKLVAARSGLRTVRAPRRAMFGS